MLPKLSYQTNNAIKCVILQTMKSKNYLINRVNSFRNAFRGIFTVIKTEAQATIHLIASIFAISVAFLLQIEDIEWLFILLAISLVWITEILNTSLERLLDHLHPEHHPNVGAIKDIAAGAVLIAALFALLTGIYIFGPPLFQLLFN